MEITSAFQPIVDLRDRCVFSYEALLRGRRGEGAGEVFDRVPAADRYAFDQTCRVAAVALAARLGVTTSLSVNALPNALYDGATSLAATLNAVRRHGFPAHRLIFELTEGEEVRDVSRVRAAIRACQEQGARVHLDDFGAGFSGLTLLVDLAPDAIKLDRGLVRGIDGCRQRREIVSGVATACDRMGVGVIAEGVETAAELIALQDVGIRYAQGYLFARPAFERLPAVRWPIDGVRRRESAVRC